MPLTIARLMKTRILKEARLVAGHGGIDRLADSVNMMDAPDIIEWIRPQQILITTLYSVKDNGLLLNSLIPQLAERGCAALGIKPQRYLERVPSVLYEQADEWRLPVIELPAQLPLGILSHEITRALLVRDEFEWNENSTEAACLELTDVALSGHMGWEAIAQYLSQVWDASVGLLDNARGIRAFSSRSMDVGVFESVVARLHERSSYFDDGRPQGLVAGGETAERLPVIREGVCYGEIIILRRCKPLGTLMSAAAQAIALLSARQSWSLQILYTQRRQWIDLVTSAGAALAQASPVCSDRILMRGPYGAMIVRVHNGPGLQRMGNHWDRRESLLGDTAQWIQTFLTNKGWEILVASDNDELVAVGSPPSNPLPSAEASWAPDHLVEIGNTLWNHFHIRVSFALGRLYPLITHLSFSLQEAREVTENPVDDVVNVYQARSIQALLRQIAADDRERFVTEVFGPLLTLPEPERAVLLQTLDIFLEYQNQASEAAKVLFVHRNTVLYRVRKLEDLLHRSLSVADDLLTVRLALIFLKELDFWERGGGQRR